MIKYTLIRTGCKCPQACAFCTEHGGGWLPETAIQDQILRANKPMNLFFGEGNPAEHDAILRVVGLAMFEKVRRIKMKISGPVAPGLLEKLVALGVHLYEVDCLGADAAVHDALTGRPGAFATACGIMTRLARPLRSDGARVFWIMNVPLCEMNAPQVTDLVALAARMRPDRLRFINTGTCSLSRLILDLRAACSLLVAGRIWPVLSGFPFCAVPGLEYFCQELYDPQALREFPGFCNGCILRNACCGVDADYVERFGEGEFKAITWHRYSKEILDLAGVSDATESI